MKGAFARNVFARVARVRGRTWAKLAAAASLLVLWSIAGGGHRRSWPRADILDAIRFVESSGRERPPDGDGGKAIGPYQIWQIYWQDAIAAEPSIGGSYEDCRDRDYAERVVAAYMRRWVPEAWNAGDAEVIARVHNGGPRGFENPKTDRYWDKVRSRLP
ncbi:MAG: hypothetical protein JNK78_10015 [Planctomycetes bacterium]|nr:hypothetical protein [Planctomycetota bacterium]